MNNLIVETYNVDNKFNVYIINDTYLEGGTKQRAMIDYITDILIQNENIDEFVYAGPRYGYAQVAISFIVCNHFDLKFTSLVEWSGYNSQYTEPMILCEKYGGNIKEVYRGSIRKKYFGNLKTTLSFAKTYVQNHTTSNKTKTENNKYLLPFGLDDELFEENLKINLSCVLRPSKIQIKSKQTDLQESRNPVNSSQHDDEIEHQNILEKMFYYSYHNDSKIKIEPKIDRLWLVAGSGTLLKILSEILPNTYFCVVAVGKKIWPDQLPKNRSTLYVHTPEKKYFDTIKKYKSKKYWKSSGVNKQNFWELSDNDIPYTSSKNYDSKIWEYVKFFGQDGDFVWNVK